MSRSKRISARSQISAGVVVNKYDVDDTVFHYAFSRHLFIIFVERVCSLSCSATVAIYNIGSIVSRSNR